MNRYRVPPQTSCIRSSGTTESWTHCGTAITCEQEFKKHWFAFSLKHHRIGLNQQTCDVPPSDVRNEEFGMLNHLLMSHLTGSFYSSHTHLCSNCGSGPLMVGDGFLVDRCLNCGRYQHVPDLVVIDLGWLGSKLAVVWKAIKSQISRPQGDQAQPCCQECLSI